MTVPELDGHVWVKQATIEEAERNRDIDIGSTVLNVVIMSTCDEHGNLMFSPDDAAWMRQMPVAVFRPIFEAGVRLNGLSKREVDEIESDFTETPTGSSSSS